MVAEPPFAWTKIEEQVISNSRGASMLINRRAFILGILSALPCASRVFAGENLAALAGQIASDGPVCGIQIATLRAGQIAQTLAVSGCGTAPLDGTVFQAASLSKPVVAFLALRMAGRGELGLDTPVSTWLPGGYPHRQNIFALKAAPVVDLVPPDILRQVTPRMLLSHSAGFPNWSQSGPLKPEFTPGARWQYSGEGYVLLQRVLETISGQPLHELAARDVFGPMGMTNTAFKITGAVEPYLVAGSPRQLRFPYEIASSSLYTNATSYARFLAGLLADEKIMALTLSHPVALPSSWGAFLQPKRLSWGLGWGVEVRDAPVAIWHWGNNPGFRSLVMADLQSRDAIVVLTASDQGMAAAKRLVNAELPGGHPALELDLVR